MNDHSQCRNMVRAGMNVAAGQDVDLEIYEGELPPPGKGTIQPYGYGCPHGTTYWVLPTDTQIDAWDTL